MPSRWIGCKPIFLTIDEVLRIHARSSLNGVYAQPSAWELYLAMIDVAGKKKTKADLAKIFRKCAELDNQDE